MWKYLTWLNVFQHCKFLRLLGHIMVLLVLSIVGFTWYAVVPATYGPKMVSGSPGSRFGSSVLVVVFSWLVSKLCRVGVSACWCIGAPGMQQSRVYTAHSCCVRVAPPSCQQAKPLSPQSACRPPPLPPTRFGSVCVHPLPS